MKNTVLIVDGSSVGSRAYAVGEIMAFFNMLSDVLRENEATHCVFVFDSGKSLRRLAIYPQYKANREPNPARNEFISFLRSSLESSGFRVVVGSGREEGDDVVYTIAKQVGTLPNTRAVVLSGDSDMMALVALPEVDLIWYGRNFFDRFLVTEDDVVARFGVPSSKVWDMKALAGDSADNIPGVPKVGPVRAAKILANGCLSEILDNPELIEDKKLRKMVVAHEEQARLSYKLARFYETEHFVELDTCKVPETPLPLGGAVMLVRKKLHLDEIEEGLPPTAPFPGIDEVFEISKHVATTTNDNYLNKATVHDSDWESNFAPGEFVEF